MDLNKSITCIIYAIGIAIIIYSVGYAISIILPSLGAMIGIVVSVSATGFATAGVVASWIPQAAAFGTTFTGLGLGCLVIYKIVEKSKEKTYEWLLPILSISSGFFAQLGQDIAFNTNLEKYIYAALAGFFICIGGVVLMKRKLFLGFLLTFFPIIIPMVLFFKNPVVQEKALNELLSSNYLAILGLVGMLVVSIISYIAATIFTPSIEPVGTVSRR